jgi:hypothetical protein
VSCSVKVDSESSLQDYCVLTRDMVSGKQRLRILLSVKCVGLTVQGKQ